MPCDGNASCTSTTLVALNYYDSDITNATAANGTNYTERIDDSPTQSLLAITTTTTTSSTIITTIVSTTSTTDDFDLHQLPSIPGEGTIVSILCFSVIVCLCSCMVLLSTRFTSGGRSATLVFLRSLCLSDILMSTYGMSKMTMLLYFDRLNMNFFLPESLFFTASLASTMSLLSLNMDCFMKLARPLKYAQVDKDTVITIMLLMWNAAFIVGFLPLLGWNDEDYTVRFFSFYPWHYLLFNGFVIFVCVVICIVCMVSLKKFYTLPQVDPDCFSTRTLEIRKYQHLHRTIIVESVMWLWCYLPFFLYIALTCPQCLLSDYTYRDSTIIYFIPIFLFKSLISSALQAFRTFHVHAIMNKLISDSSLVRHLRQRRREKECQPKDEGVSAIAYTNPLCESQFRDGSRHPFNGEHRLTLGRHQVTLHQAISDTDLTELTQVSDILPNMNGSNSSMTGITNHSFRPSIDFGQPVDLSQETTAL